MHCKFNQVKDIKMRKRRRNTRLAAADVMRGLNERHLRTALTFMPLGYKDLFSYRPEKTLNKTLNNTSNQLPFPAFRTSGSADKSLESTKRLNLKVPRSVQTVKKVRGHCIIKAEVVGQILVKHFQVLLPTKIILATHCPRIE